MKTVLKWLGNYFKHIDWILMLICLCISAFDIYLLCSLNEIGFVKDDYIQTQLVACGIGVCACIVIGMIDFRISFCCACISAFRSELSCFRATPAPRWCSCLSSSA